MSEDAKVRHGPYCGYYDTDIGSEDKELTHVVRGTPCGEYMRRFWHPVAMASELKDVPLLVRVLGEDLILFRDLGGRLGLVHRHCVHRHTSLEYGIVSERGLRCCYHGWLYDVDGTILETPGEPPGSRAAEALSKSVRLGAYPVHEYKGLIFAYLGPPGEKPRFPIYDTFEIPSAEMVPYAMDFPCNWLQVVENGADPVHTVFLHSRSSGLQFSAGWGELGQIEYHESAGGVSYTFSRRVEENIWTRIVELMLPNYGQAGAVMSMDGRKRTYFGRNAFARWVVPIDNVNTKVIAWAIFGERSDPPEWRSEENIQIMEQGEILGRPYEQRQRRPADYEALTGQGAIAAHSKEHLLSTDKGVIKFRRRLRKEIRAVKAGRNPYQASERRDALIPTYAGDTVLRVPLLPGKNDSELFSEVPRQILAIYAEADNLKGHERDEQIMRRLQELESSYA